MKNLTVKIFVGLFVVAAVLLQSCKKDSETYSFLLNERGAFVEEPGGTTSLGFTAINISSVTPTTVPQGWSVTVDMNERRISVTAPTTFPDDPKTLADGEEEEEENTNVRFGTVYLTGRSSGGSSVSTSLYVSLAETVDLTGQPSNCYIINKSNARYCIDVTRKGEDTEATMSPASVAILWETPYKVIEFPKLVDGKAYFYHAIGTDDDEKEFFNHGNALLGAFDAAGNLLWSWHLWCAEFDPADEQVELGGEVMMKRNLGAGVVSGTSEEDILASYGVYYQWGRKEPFVGPRYYNMADSADAQVYDSQNLRVYPEYAATDAERGSAGYASAHAMTFITGTKESGYNWLQTADASLWGTEKNNNDPCPKGWKVPSKEVFAALHIKDVISPELEKNYGFTLSDGTERSLLPRSRPPQFLHRRADQHERQRSASDSVDGVLLEFDGRRQRGLCDGFLVRHQRHACRFVVPGCGVAVCRRRYAGSLREDTLSERAPSPVAGVYRIVEAGAIPAFFRL